MSYKLFVYVARDGALTSQVIEFEASYKADTAFENLRKMFGVSVVKLY